MTKENAKELEINWGKVQDSMDLLAHRGWVLIEDFISPTSVQTLSDHIDYLMSNSLMTPAKIGRVNTKQREISIRGDYIHWVTNDENDHQTRIVFEMLEKMRSFLNQELLLPLKRFEIHFALYPAGTGYDMHIDQHKGQNQRIITFVLYLNKNWKIDDGGENCLHDPISSELLQKTYPFGGNLLLFKSDIFPHEVIKSKKDRKSLTGWFRNDN